MYVITQILNLSLIKLEQKRNNDELFKSHLGDNIVVILKPSIVQASSWLIDVVMVLRNNYFYIIK